MKHFNRQTQLLQRNFFFALLAVGLFLALPALTFAAPGDLDPTFGNGGKVITDFNSGESASAVVLQPDGKLIIAGTTIVRYNGNGSLDTSFGNGGRVSTGFGAAAVVLQPDDKIVAAGNFSFGSYNNFVFVRYNADGSLDSTLTATAKPTLPFFARLTACGICFVRVQDLLPRSLAHQWTKLRPPTLTATAKPTSPFSAKALGIG